ncbi:MAG: hypothetical protein ACRDJF_07285 [Actinomycetota bacterium]
MAHSVVQPEGSPSAGAEHPREARDFAPKAYREPKPKGQEIHHGSLRLAYASDFREAARRGILISSGTDPLPLPSQVSRVGGFGFRLDGATDLSSPADGIKAALGDPGSRLTPFARLERALPFLHHLIAMQRRNRWRAPRPAASRRRDEHTFGSD